MTGAQFWLWKDGQEDWPHCVCYEYLKDQEAFPASLVTRGNKFDGLREGDSGTYHILDTQNGVRRDVRGTWEVMQPMPSLRKLLETSRKQQKVVFEKTYVSGIIEHYTMRVKASRQETQQETQEERELLRDSSFPNRMRVTFRNGFLACIRTNIPNGEKSA